MFKLHVPAIPRKVSSYPTPRLSCIADFNNSLIGSSTLLVVVSDLPPGRMYYTMRDMYDT